MLPAIGVAIEAKQISTKKPYPPVCPEGSKNSKVSSVKGDEEEIPTLASVVFSFSDDTSLPEIVTAPVSQVERKAKFISPLFTVIFTTSL